MPAFTEVKFESLSGMEAALLRTLNEAPLAMQRVGTAQFVSDLLVEKLLVSTVNGYYWLNINGLRCLADAGAFGINEASFTSHMEAKEAKAREWHAPQEGYPDDLCHEKCLAYLGERDHARRLLAFLKGESEPNDVYDALEYAMDLWRKAATTTRMDGPWLSVQAELASDLAHLMKAELVHY